MLLDNNGDAIFLEPPYGSTEGALKAPVKLTIEKTIEENHHTALQREH